MTDTATATLDTVLADLVRSRPALAGTSDRLGLDFCCHGDRTLGEACEASGLPASEVLAAMQGGADDQDTSEWAHLDATELADHIEAVHHRWLHNELPELQLLAAKVFSVHGSRHPELDRVRRLVDDLVADFIPHMGKEERVLFPAVRALTQGGGGFPFGSVTNPIAVMTAEHETVGAMLAELRQATNGYCAPEDGCASYRLLYQRLEAVEADTHLHVFKENSVFFPAANQLERDNAGSVSR